MPSIQFVTLLLAIVGAITGGAYQLAKSNYYYFVGMLSVIHPILIFLCGLTLGLQFSSLENDLKIHLIAVAVALFITSFCLSTVKDMTKPEK